MFKKSKILINDLRVIYKHDNKKKLNYQKVLWSSESSMIGRFWLLKNLIKKKNFLTWLDVGCGTGDIFRYFSNYNILKYGIEQSRYLCRLAKKENPDVTIFNRSLNNFNRKDYKFSLVSCIGVLQNCGCAPTLFLNKICKLIEKKGMLFLTSKNINWNQFKINGFIINSNHSWFDIGEIKKILAKNNLKIIKAGGFLPKKKKITKINESHTFYIWAKKK